MHLFSSNRIYLIGYMGSGKSTIGKQLAMQLGYLFLDTDEVIEQLAGKSVKSIFEDEGEKTFRRRERDLIAFVSELDKVVIATGGGLPVHNNNLQVLLASGITYFIDCPVEVLASRITSNADRPLHSDHKTADELAEKIKLRLDTRMKFYQEAHCIIDGHKEPTLIIEQILVSLRGEYGTIAP